MQIQLSAEERIVRAKSAFAALQLGDSETDTNHRGDLVIHGQLYDITWRIAVNADWTRSETLLFTGLDGPYAVFEDRHSIEKPFHIRPEWITDLALSEA